MYPQPWSEHQCTFDVIPSGQTHKEMIHDVNHKCCSLHAVYVWAGELGEADNENNMSQDIWYDCQERRKSAMESAHVVEVHLNSGSSSG